MSSQPTPEPSGPPADHIPGTSYGRSPARKAPAFPQTGISVPRAAARRTMAFGLLWFVAGIVVSVLTMAGTAGSNSHGVILWGLSLYGVVQIVRGSIAYGRA